MISPGTSTARETCRIVEAAPVETHVCDFGRGPRLVTAGCAVLAGDATRAESGQRAVALTILAAHAPSALCMTLDPDTARAIGALLIDIARRLEGDAADLAAAALRKAAGK